MANNICSILQSPDGGSHLDEKLVSKSGIKYKKTKSGILNLLPTKNHLNNSIYEHPMYKRWNSIIDKRMEYYTSKKTIAGKLANWSYKSIDYFNNRQTDEFLLDIGCGNGAHVSRLVNKSNYIGLDTNTHRLERLIEQYPEVTPILGDAAFLPCKDNSIKYIFSSNAFEHLWLLKNAVMECHRILKDGGRMIIVILTEGGCGVWAENAFQSGFFKRIIRISILN